MVVKAHTTSDRVRMAPPMPGMQTSKALADRAAPLAPLLQTPEHTMATPVTLQMLLVSLDVPVVPIRPDCTALVVVPAAWAIPAEPRPASLEKIPRATP